MRTKMLVAICCATLLACTQEMSRRERLMETEAVQQRFTAWVQTQNDLFVNGLNRSLLDSLGTYYEHTDALEGFWPTGGRTVGWEQFNDRMGQFYARFQSMNVVVTDPSVELFGPNAALTTFRHSTDVLLGPRARVVHPGAGTLMWAKDPTDGVWRIHLQHLSWDAPSLN